MLPFTASGADAVFHTEKCNIAQTMATTVYYILYTIEQRPRWRLLLLSFCLGSPTPILRFIPFGDEAAVGRSGAAFDVE